MCAINYADHTSSLQYVRRIKQPFAAVANRSASTTAPKAGSYGVVRADESESSFSVDLNMHHVYDVS